MPICLHLFGAVNILFVSIKTAFSIVQSFLKPNCSDVKILFPLKCLFYLLNITLSSIFENVDSSEIGLKFDTLVLSPF